MKEVVTTSVRFTDTELYLQVKLVADKKQWSISKACIMLIKEGLISLRETDDGK
jgi:hypothetical protein